MGWTSKKYQGEGNHTDWPLKDLGDFLNNEIVGNGYYIIKCHYHRAHDEYDHNQLYLVMQHPEGRNFIMVVLVDIKDSEIYWKEIEESCGPVYHNCPLAYLDLFKAPNEYAESWRKECRKMNITNSV